MFFLHSLETIIPYMHNVEIKKRIDETKRGHSCESSMVLILGALISITLTVLSLARFLDFWTNIIIFIFLE